MAKTPCGVRHRMMIAIGSEASFTVLGCYTHSEALRQGKARAHGENAPGASIADG